MLADYYQSEDPQRSIQLRNDAASMEAADNSMKILFGNGMAAWPYSDKRALMALANSSRQYPQHNLNDMGCNEAGRI